MCRAQTDSDLEERCTVRSLRRYDHDDEAVVVAPELEEASNCSSVTTRRWWHWSDYARPSLVAKRRSEEIEEVTIIKVERRCQAVGGEVV
jgi:hypothetical protein